MMSGDKATPRRKAKRSSAGGQSKRKKSREKEYEVEAILSHEVIDGEVVYKVSWVGYPGETTELLEEDLKNCGEMLEAYKQRMEKNGCTDFTSETLSVVTSVTDKSSCIDEKVETDGALANTPKGSPSKPKGSPSKRKESPSKVQQNGTVTKASPHKETNGFSNGIVGLDDDDAPLAHSLISISKEKKRKDEAGGHASQPAKRVRKTKRREIAPDDELGYNNGCVVDEYKGFSVKYTEPVIMVSYKEPLPDGFESKQDEIVPIRVIKKKDPERLIDHLVDLLSAGRTH